MDRSCAESGEGTGSLTGPLLFLSGVFGPFPPRWPGLTWSDPEDGPPENDRPESMGEKLEGRLRRIPPYRFPSP